MSAPSPPAPPAPQPPRLLDLVRQLARDLFGQDGPAERHAHWARTFIRFHDKRVLPPIILSSRSAEIGRDTRLVVRTGLARAHGRPESPPS
jgi:hypothetical protein